MNSAIPWMSFEQVCSTMDEMGKSNNPFLFFVDYKAESGWIGTPSEAQALGIKYERGSNKIAYSSDGINWTGIGSTIFTGAGIGVAWNDAEGYVNMTTSITLNKYGSGLSNKIDVVSDSYYNPGFTNFSLSIES